jgi:hypothetical protein
MRRNQILLQVAAILLPVLFHLKVLKENKGIMHTRCPRMQKLIDFKNFSEGPLEFLSTEYRFKMLSKWSKQQDVI